MNRSAAAEQLYSAGLLAWEQGHGIAAEPLLQQAVDLAPDHGSALHVLGKLRAHDGKLEEALHLQQRSCLVDPALGWNWFSAGELLARQQRWDEAKMCFEQALDRLPAEDWISEHWQQAQMRLLLGGEVLRQGLGPQAYRYWINHCEQRLPPSPQPLVTPFWLWRQKGEPGPKPKKSVTDEPTPAPTPTPKPVPKTKQERIEGAKKREEERKKHMIAAARARDKRKDKKAHQPHLKIIVFYNVFATFSQEASEESPHRAGERRQRDGERQDE